MRMILIQLFKKLHIQKHFFKTWVNLAISN